MGQCGGHLAHGSQPRDMDQLRLHVMEPPFRRLRLGEVADEACEEPPPAAPHLPDSQLDREGGTVPAHPYRHPANPDDLPLAGIEITSEVLGVLGPVGVWHEQGDITADRLGRGPTEQPFSRRAEGADGPGLVDDDHRLGHGVEDGLEVILPLFRKGQHGPRGGGHAPEAPGRRRKGAGGGDVEHQAEDLLAVHKGVTARQGEGTGQSEEGGEDHRSGAAGNRRRQEGRGEEEEVQARGGLGREDNPSHQDNHDGGHGEAIGQPSPPCGLALDLSLDLRVHDPDSYRPGSLVGMRGV